MIIFLNLFPFFFSLKNFNLKKELKNEEKKKLKCALIYFENRNLNMNYHRSLKIFSTTYI